MLIGEPTDRKMSDAFLSAMTWNNRFIADMLLSPECQTASLIPAQQFVQTGFCPRSGVHLLDDDRTVKSAATVPGGHGSGNHNRACRHPAVEHLAGFAVEDLGALADIDP